MLAESQEQADHIFDQLMSRPSNYLSLSEEDQWEIDKMLGLLDLEIPPKFFHGGYLTRWKNKFG